MLHVENLLYLALVLNFVFHSTLPMSCMQKTLIFGACGELPLLFGTADVLHCKIPLVFSACVELRFSFNIFDVLHCRTPLILGAWFELGL